MARQKKSALPKVISKANKEISTLIENDIAQESLLLQKLVEDVLKANMDIKKSNNQRINESKEKLEKLDKEIAKLSKAIDNVDRETIALQLSEMLDIENQIFDANNIVRFFEHKKQLSNIEEFDRLFKEFEKSLESKDIFDERMSKSLIDSNTLFFKTQVEISHEIINQMKQLFIAKDELITNKQVKIKEFEQLVIAAFDKYQSDIKTNHQKFLGLKSSTTSIFSRDDNDVMLAEKLQNEHVDNLEKISSSIDSLKENFKEKTSALENEFALYEESVNAKIISKNEKQILKEKDALAKKEASLKDIRLQILNAEKRRDQALVSKLLLQYEKADKVKVEKATAQAKKLTSKQTKKMKIKTLNQLKSVQSKYTSDLSKLEYSLEFENISFDESKVLYKIKSDNQALINDKSLAKDIVNNIETLIKERFIMEKEVNKLKESMRKSELLVMKENEILELSIYPEFTNLLIKLKEVEHKRIAAIKETLIDQEEIGIRHAFQIKKSKAEIKYNDAIQDIDKAITKKEKEIFIRNSKLQEEAASEIIYQESVIKIAQKEHELQVLKVKSLHENERALAEEQVARINLGVKVNDAFVKTTLESQLLFASQQINCAKSEYDIRLESISLTLNQELDYSNKKLDYLRQKYEYDKNKLRKELASKLEDLNYKLVLFTDQKDNKNTQDKITELEEYYSERIAEIEAVENEDLEIARYNRVVEEAKVRAEKAILEAEQLRNTTMDSFQDLHDKTKMKYDTIKETKQTEETKGLLPVMNNPANENADERLRQATLEAERLYKEKIAGPTEIIEKTKTELERNISNQDLDIFVEQQKALKANLRDKHIILINDYKVQLEEDLKPIAIKKDDLSKNLTEELAKIPEILNAQVLYRTVKDIEADYNVLIKNNLEHFKAKLSEFEKEHTIDTTESSKILKEVIDTITTTHKPYKVYIKFASKGLNSRKKEINKKYKRKLKRDLSDINSDFKMKINEL